MTAGTFLRYAESADARAGPNMGGGDEGEGEGEGGDAGVGAGASAGHARLDSSLDGLDGLGFGRALPARRAGNQLGAGAELAAGGEGEWWDADSVCLARWNATLCGCASLDEVPAPRLEKLVAAGVPVQHRMHVWSHCAGRAAAIAATRPAPAPAAAAAPSSPAAACSAFAATPSTSGFGAPSGFASTPGASPGSRPPAAQGRFREGSGKGPGSRPSAAQSSHKVIEADLLRNTAVTLGLTSDSSWLGDTCQVLSPEPSLNLQVLSPRTSSCLMPTRRWSVRCAAHCTRYAMRCPT